MLAGDSSKALPQCPLQFLEILPVHDVFYLHWHRVLLSFREIEKVLLFIIKDSDLPCVDSILLSQ